MTVPIPQYLISISEIIKSEKDIITFSISCTCKNDRFIISKNFLSSEQKKELDDWEKEFNNKVGKASYFCQSDKNGNVCWYKSSWLGLRKTKIDIRVPETIAYTVVKANCTKCDKEHIIFDQRYHGYDGVMTDLYQKCENDTVNFKQLSYGNSSKECKVIIKLQNDENIDEFIEAVGEEVDAKTYSNAFGWITIKIIDEETKKSITILDLETA